MTSVSSSFRLCVIQLCFVLLASVTHAAPTLEAPGVTVQYTEGDEARAGRAAALVHDLSDRVEAVLGVAPPEPVTVVIALTDAGYERAVRDLAGGGPPPPTWSLAAAIGARNAVVIRASRLEMLTWAGLEPTLAHELSHLALERLGPALPRWLEEGLCSFAAGRRLSREERTYLARLARTEGVPELRDLARTFPDHPAEAEASYLLSLAFVEALEARGGAASVKALVLEMERGRSLEAAFERVYDAPIEGFAINWRARLAESYSLLRDIFERASLFTGLALFVAFAAVVVIARRRRQLARMDGGPSAENETEIIDREQRGDPDAPLPQEPR